MKPTNNVRFLPVTRQYFYCKQNFFQNISNTIYFWLKFHNYKDFIHIDLIFHHKYFVFSHLYFFGQKKTIFLQAEPSVKAVNSNYLGVELHFTPERLSNSVCLKIVKIISAKFAYPISVILHHSLRFKIAKIISAKFAYPIFWYVQLSQVMYCMEGGGSRLNCIACCIQDWGMHWVDLRFKAINILTWGGKIKQINISAGRTKLLANKDISNYQIHVHCQKNICVFWELSNQNISNYHTHLHWQKKDQG